MFNLIGIQILDTLNYYSPGIDVGLILNSETYPESRIR